MDLYVKVSLATLILGLILRLATLSTSKYPRVETIEIGRDLTTIIINILVLVWTGSLVFFK
jgi:hypothetical protein